MTAYQFLRRSSTAAAVAALALSCPAAHAAEPGSPGSLFQVVPGLLFVLALIAACAWVAKRVGPVRAGNNAAIKFVSSQSVGGRDRVVIVEVNNQWLVLGVSPGRVNTLSQMAKPEAVQAEAAAVSGAANAVKPPFAAWLEKAMGKK
jgi:flagellar protein FliO/FliZ